MSNGNGESNLTGLGKEPTEAQLLEMDHDIERSLRNDGLRNADMEEVGWNRYRQLINMLRGHDNTREIGEDLKLLVRFASATHQYLRREKELDYVLKAFQELPLGPKGIHF